MEGKLEGAWGLPERLVEFGDSASPARPISDSYPLERARCATTMDLRTYSVRGHTGLARRSALKPRV